MWSCFLGEITAPYRRKWEPQTVSPDQTEPDVYDVLTEMQEIGYRLDMIAAKKCFSDCIQVDWGGWAYKATKAQILLFWLLYQYTSFTLPLKSRAIKHFR